MRGRLAPLGDGALYAGAVFAAGVVLGTGRVLVLEPALGPVGAVLLEIPVILAVAWVVCEAVIARRGVPRRWPARAAMGAIAFGLLMAAELGLAALLFGRGPAAVLAGFGAPEAALGLAAQVTFGLLPLLALVRSRRQDDADRADGSGEPAGRDAPLPPTAGARGPRTGSRNTRQVKGSAALPGLSERAGGGS